MMHFFPVVRDDTFVPDEESSYRILVAAEVIQRDDQILCHAKFFCTRGSRLVADICYAWRPGAGSLTGTAHVGGPGAYWIRRKTGAPGAMPGRFYGYTILSRYRGVTIWMFNSDGARMGGTTTRPIRGASDRERYDVVATAIANVGLTPPRYEQTAHA